MFNHSKLIATEVAALRNQNYLDYQYNFQNALLEICVNHVETQMALSSWKDLTDSK